MNRSTPLFAITLLFLLGISSIAGIIVFAEPNGVTVVSNTTATATPTSAAAITTAGGSFTTLLLNATTQTLRWKAYVGNITGSLTLQDGANFTIYDWSLSSPAGEVYASRNNSISWSAIRCGVTSILQTEQTQLNITTTKEDSINRTFNNTIHRGFYVGTTLIQNSTCRAIATYVNNTRQSSAENATFQEVLLDDTVSIVYATLLEANAQGYNNGQFDFQMIVPDSDVNPTPSTYYFWAELS